jgi:small subunit ribosomal protein S1
MSWTKRISHPSELVHIDQEVEVMVLDINQEKQEISLGMKQTQSNPWDKVADRYPPGAMVKGRVRNLTNYGAFIEIEEGIDGLLHVSDMSWTRKIGHPSEVVEKGQEVECKVVSVDQERRRIALGLKQLDDDPWATDIPNRYQPGQLVKGKVTKITNFGVFVGWSMARGTTTYLERRQGREPGGCGKGWRRDRSEDPPRRCGRAEDRPVAEALNGLTTI